MLREENNQRWADGMKRRSCYQPEVDTFSITPHCGVLHLESYTTAVCRSHLFIQVLFYPFVATLNVAEHLQIGFNPVKLSQLLYKPVP